MRFHLRFAANVDQVDFILGVPVNSDVSDSLQDMKFAALLVILIIVQCVISDRCKKRRNRRYGGQLLFCGRHVIQRFKGQYYEIEYKPRPKPVGVDEEATTEETETTEEATTEEAEEIDYNEETQELVVNWRRQLITAPPKCQGGFDANGSCVPINQTFNK
ncbi:hypothetical protein Trydic_g17753 [Trypoxylus dichotomus]